MCHSFPSTLKRFGMSPFVTDIFSDEITKGDILPALYHDRKSQGPRKHCRTRDPSKDVLHFLGSELSVGHLDILLKHLWYAGSRRPPVQLHHQVAVGRQIALVDRLDLHLVLTDSGTLFVKALPQFLINPAFWNDHLECRSYCKCQLPGRTSTTNNLTVCVKQPRQVALGLLYSYICLVSSESDFFVANEKRLLPRKSDGSAIAWGSWKSLARELHENIGLQDIHPRFHRAELRLSRLNTISRITNLSAFRPYLRSWHNYSTYFRDNITWVASAVVFAAFVLTAMQVGLATDKLRENAQFQRASYGFTVFSILGLLGMVVLMAMFALLNLVLDLPGLNGDRALSDTQAALSNGNGTSV